MRPSAMTARYAGTHACFWAALCPLVTFSALYLQRKGFSTVQVGTVLSLATIFPAFVQPFLASAADRSRRWSLRVFLTVLAAALLAALGVIFAVCAFFLLRRREMERSGSVIAVGWLRPVALYVFTIGCALVVGEVLMELLASNTADNFWYVLLFLMIGAFLGYFSGRMLLQKTVHVFRHGWIGFGACCLALLLAFSLGMIAANGGRFWNPFAQ